MARTLINPNEQIKGWAEHLKRIEDLKARVEKSEARIADLEKAKDQRSLEPIPVEVLNASNDE